jgi:hypothetical protein
MAGKGRRRRRMKKEMTRPKENGCVQAKPRNIPSVNHSQQSAHRARVQQNDVDDISHQQMEKRTRKKEKNEHVQKV